jgi:galactokinase/mevalonate kinase-like predicted kinase
MTIVRCPLPIALGSGYTDWRSYNRDYGEFIVAAAI